MTGIIDYGAGNIRSVINAFDYLGEKTALVSDPDALEKYDRVVLPGVGAFGAAMMKLKAASMDEAILNFISSGRPFLGICLGMQLLFEKGLEFGEHEGLGVVKGKIVKFEEDRFSSPLKVPHVGWNVCDFTRETPINKGFEALFTQIFYCHSIPVSRFLFCLRKRR